MLSASAFFQYTKKRVLSVCHVSLVHESPSLVLFRHVRVQHWHLIMPILSCSSRVVTPASESQ